MATVYIQPGSGTGTGTEADPYYYSQLATAETAAGSGGKILFNDGSYAIGTLDESGVTYEAVNIHGAVFSGSGDLTLGSSSNSVTARKLKIELGSGGRIQFRGATTLIDQCHITVSNSFVIWVDTAGGKITNSLIENNITDTSYNFRLGRSWNSLSEFKGNTYSVTGLNGLGVTNIDFYISGPDAKNCIFMSDDTANTVISSAENTAASSTNCCFFQFGSGNTSGGTNNVFSNPLFVDSANTDFRLRPGSPCINAGTAS